MPNPSGPLSDVNLLIEVSAPTDCQPEVESIYNWRSRQQRVEPPCYQERCRLGAISMIYAYIIYDVDPDLRALCCWPSYAVL